MTAAVREPGCQGCNAAAIKSARLLVTLFRPAADHPGVTVRTMHEDLRKVWTELDRWCLGGMCEADEGGWRARKNCRVRRALIAQVLVERGPPQRERRPLPRERAAGGGCQRYGLIPGTSQAVTVSIAHTVSAKAGSPCNARQQQAGTKLLAVPVVGTNHVTSIEPSSRLHDC